MASLFAKLCEFLGGVGSSLGSTACTIWFYDEPEMPRSLIEK